MDKTFDMIIGIYIFWPKLVAQYFSSCFGYFHIINEYWNVFVLNEFSCCNRIWDGLIPS